MSKAGMIRRTMSFAASQCGWEAPRAAKAKNEAIEKCAAESLHPLIRFAVVIAQEGAITGNTTGGRDGLNAVSIGRECGAEIRRTGSALPHRVSSAP